MKGLRHIAVIMDGNGRWAAAHRKARISGHRAGADALDRMMHYCRDEGVEFLTVYAFSTENWKRSKLEVSGLMKLLSSYIDKKKEELKANKVRFRVIGRRQDLSNSIQKKIAALEEYTKDGDFTLVVALSYGARDEILRAAKAFARDAITSGGKNLEALKEDDFAKYLDTSDIPDPDLIIRTSGELRLSNFLLWQAAYAEFYFTDTLWPDFDREQFDKAIESFSHRERRLGARLK
ncbi:MAG: di-trans,poly-cis-decaprenylcistransferase [Kiritimatiellae bacterium]|nr:di-trans,poly-cis-decaprenylcistransferase [Kiritimatiellia bacterium]